MSVKRRVGFGTGMGFLKDAFLGLGLGLTPTLKQHFF